MKPLLCLGVLACLALSTVHAAERMPRSTTPITLMPFGDSITEGGTGFHIYRYPLMEKLREAGYNITYVGSKTTHSVTGSPLGVLRHEGYAGQNSTFLNARFETLYRANPADILLIHAGHNQSADQHPIPGLLKDTRAIITTARTINPKVVVLLAQVITSGKLPKYSYIPAFNQELIALAASLNTAEQPVVLVNQADGFNWRTDTVDDRVHPNAQGAEKMAARWFDSLKKILPPPATKTAGVKPAATDVPLKATAPQSLRLWPADAQGVPSDPGAEVTEPGERISNVSVPTLDVYLPPPDKANGTAIIICSGGGYTKLASGPLGRGAADVFGPRGYAVFSLKYRTRPPSKDVLKDALADARQAVRLVRSRAAEWRINPDRVGMVGFSAGANLILNLATSSTAGDPTAADPLARWSDRPDFVGLAATWAFNQKSTSFAIDERVPPAFILHARDDTTAPIAFAEEIAAAWHKAGAPVAFHPYEKGEHMVFNFPATHARDWPERFMTWLEQSGPAR
jgi:acetyl esterase/lipase/lysophospholipase L1-like esterase